MRIGILDKSYPTMRYVYHKVNTAEYVIERRFSDYHSVFARIHMKLKKILNSGG